MERELALEFVRVTAAHWLLLVGWDEAIRKRRMMRL